jgi:hypothetical protein
MSAWNWKNLFRGNVAPTQPQTPVLDTSKPLPQSTSQILPTQTTSSSQTKSIHEFHLKILIVGSPGAGNNQIKIQINRKNHIYQKIPQRLLYHTNSNYW